MARNDPDRRVFRRYSERYDRQEMHVSYLTGTYIKLTYIALKAEALTSLTFFPDRGQARSRLHGLKRHGYGTRVSAWNSRSRGLTTCYCCTRQPKLGTAPLLCGIQVGHGHFGRWKRSLEFDGQKANLDSFHSPYPCWPQTRNITNTKTSIAIVRRIYWSSHHH